MTFDRPSDYEPPHAASPTSHLLDELQLYGCRPHQDEPDPRPLPEKATVRAALADIFDALVSTPSETCLEPDLDDVTRELDRNEDEQKRSEKEQDGSEIRSVELERLTAQGLTFLERRNAQEFFRDAAADLFEAHTGSTWRPRTGSKVNHRALTSALIDSRDFLPTRRRADNEVLLPSGSRIAFAGGPDCDDHSRIRDVLDKAHAKHPDMVLLHGGSSKGAERIAACWAEARKIAQVVFKPDWTKHAKAAPFKRNDAAADPADRRHRFPGLRRHRAPRRPSRACSEFRFGGSMAEARDGRGHWALRRAHFNDDQACECLVRRPLSRTSYSQG